MSLVDLINQVPSGYKEFGIVLIVMSLVEVMPVKINPWKWIKAFVELPKRMEDLEKKYNDFKTEYNNDKAYRWRSMILTRADHVRRGDKLSEERWNDTLTTIGHYKKYCKNHEKDADGELKFINGQADTAIEYLEGKYKEAYEAGDYLR